MFFFSKGFFCVIFRGFRDFGYFFFYLLIGVFRIFSRDNIRCVYDRGVYEDCMGFGM